MGMGSVTLSQPPIHSLFVLYCKAISAPHQWCEAWTRNVRGTNTSLIDGIKWFYTGDIHCVVLIKKKLGQYKLHWPNFFFIDCKTLSTVLLTEIIPYFSKFAIVAMTAAMLAALEPTLRVSARLILLCIFVGTIISQPGRTLALWPTFANIPFM